MSEKTQAEIVDIIRAERNRWLQHADESEADIKAGAVGALANVLNAIHGIDRQEDEAGRIRGKTWSGKGRAYQNQKEREQ